MIDRATKAIWRGRHWVEWSILAYYLGWVVLGAATPLLSPVHTAYAVSATLVGTWATVAWAARWRRTETTALWTLAAITLAQAVLLILWGATPDAVTSGERLLIAPLSMVPLGAVRRDEVMLEILRQRRRS